MTAPSTLNTFFSTWPALSNEISDDVIQGGFFHTCNVFYKQKPFYYKTNILLKSLKI